MIHKDMLILDILRRYPQTAEIFARHEMPCDRCMRAVDGTLSEGARMHGVPLTTLMLELEEAIGSGEPDAERSVWPQASDERAE